jgi:Xaa-Pro dipeptidase
MDGYQQAFSTDEFKGRLRRVREGMAAKGFDILLIHAPENIYYLTGYQTSGYFAYQTLIVTREGDPTLLVRYIERGCVDEWSWLRQAETWKDSEDPVAKTIDLLKAAGGERATIAIEKDGWFLTLRTFESLVRVLPAARFVDIDQVVERVRIIKSESEIRYLRQASAIAEVEQRAAAAAIRPGATEAEIAAAIYAAGVTAGCEYTGLPHHIYSGHRFNVNHANWGPKVIRKGELVAMECYGCVERYHATQMRTVSLGPLSDERRRVADLLVSAQDAQIAAMKPGASSRAVDAIVRREVRTLRADYYNRSGYSTGIGFPPKTAEWETLDFNEGSDWELKEGMVFHMLTLSHGLFFSETVAVTRHGPERLTYSNPREIIVL